MLADLSRQAPAQQVGKGFADQIQQYSSGRRSNSKRGITANEELNRLAVQNQAFLFNIGQSQVRAFQKKMAERKRLEAAEIFGEGDGHPAAGLH